MHRPEISIPLSKNDRIIEIVSLIAFLILLILPAYYFNQLPDEIPSHFNVQGEPDGYGSKYTILVLPIIGAVIYILFTQLNKYPHKFNYPQKVTEENAPSLYLHATKMMRWLKLIILIGLTYGTYATIQSALGTQEGIGKMYVPIFMFSTFLVTGVALYMSSSKN